MSSSPGEQTGQADVTSTTRARPQLFTAARRLLRGAVVLLVVRALLGVWGAVLVGRLIDQVVSGTSGTANVLQLSAVLLVRAGITAIHPHLTWQVMDRTGRDLRARVLRTVVRLPPSQGSRTGDLVVKASDGVDAVSALGGVFLPQLVSGMVIPVLVIVAVAFIDPPTAGALAVAVPLVPMLLRMLESRFASVSARYRETADRLAARFLDGVQGLATLKSLNRAEAFGDELAVESETLRAETMRLLRVNQLALLAVDGLFTLGTVVTATAMAALRLAAGAVGVGEAITLVILGSLLIEPLSQIGRFFYVGAIGRAAARQLRDLLSLETPGKGMVDETLEPGAVEVDAVSFAYPDGTVALREVNLRVSPGERVALVGPSGAGKTTLAHLVLGLLAPGEGTVRRGGGATLVPQRPFLFPGSIADNLRLARPRADDAELWEALDAASLADLMERVPDGLATRVGERGLRLSGGEAQRVAIARALLVDAPVLVLDEPTSNVDLDTEARIRLAIDRLTVGRTVVLIAHRRSTLQGVDRVVRLEDGMVVDSGRPS